MISLTDAEPVKVNNKMEVRKALAEIKARNPDNLLTAEDAVEAARDEDSPLHRHFCWDDTKAAHQYRLGQARVLFHVIVVTDPNDKEERAMPKYISLVSDRKRSGGGYRETSEVLTSKQLLAELEVTAKHDIDGVLKRYDLLKDLCARVRRAAGIKDKKKSKAAKGRA